MCVRCQLGSEELDWRTVPIGFPLGFLRFTDHIPG